MNHNSGSYVSKKLNKLIFKFENEVGIDKKYWNKKWW